MDIRNGQRHYEVGQPVGTAQDYKLYLCATEEGRQCLLQICAAAENNSFLDRTAYVLRQLKLRADELEAEYAQVKEDPDQLLNYDLQFPELVDSFICRKQGDRRINVLAFRNIEDVGKLVPIINITEKDRWRVDLRTSAWIMGKLLKLLAFAHGEGFAIGNLAGNNILIEPDQHYVVVFDWASAQICSDEIPIEIRRHDIAHAARSVVTVLGGSLKKGIPLDPGGYEGFGRYDDLILRLARGSESNAKKAHSQFYELVEQLWKREYYPFTTLPLLSQ